MHRSDLERELPRRPSPRPASVTPGFVLVVAALSLAFAVACDDDGGSGTGGDTSTSTSTAGDTSTADGTSATTSTTASTTSSTAADATSSDATTGDTATTAADTATTAADTATTAGDATATAGDTASTGGDTVVDANDTGDATMCMRPDPGSPPMVSDSCDEAGLEACFHSGECQADERCQDLSGDGSVSCCVQGPRGCGEPGDPCSDEFDCESSLCLETDDGSFCTTPCTSDADCPAQASACTPVAFAGDLCLPPP